MANICVKWEKNYIKNSMNTSWGKELVKMK